MVTDIWRLSEPSLRDYAEAISMSTEDTMLSPKCTFRFGQKGLGGTPIIDDVSCSNRHTSGHEFVGEAIALGSSFLSVSGEQAVRTGRPVLYSTLKVGDKVVSPFTVSCGECRYEVLSFTGPIHS